MKWADKEKALQRFKDAGLTVSVLDQRPDLYPDLFLVFESFLMLHGMRERDMAGTPKAIQMSEILSSYQGYEFFDMFAFPDYLRLIVSMDRAARKIMLEQLNGN